MELNFKRPELEDQELIRGYFVKYPSRACDRSFANVYLWSRHDQVEYAVIEGALVFCSRVGEDLYFAWPAGEPAQIQAALNTLDTYVREKGQPLRLYHLREENFALLEEWEPNTWQIAYNRDVADYVYETEKLITLGGKKLHSKRNHINKFKSLYDNWSYESLCDENLDDCFQMALKWRNSSGCDDDPEKNKEMCVALNSLRLHKELNLKGGLIRVDGAVVAFSMGEKLCEDTFVVHIEKAFTEIEGAYTVMNQQFVEHECKEYQYVNREEDAGSEGLRKAKLSYRPVMMIEKGVATRK